MFDKPNSLRWLSPVLLFAVIGCQNGKPTVSEQRPESQAEREFKTEANDPTDRILLSDTALYPDHSGMRVIGDSRPIYVAEGRVTSNLLYANADEVVLKVYFVDKNANIIDTDKVIVRDISPQGTKAFRKTVQLLPPAGKYSYSFAVSSVKTSPSAHPWPDLR